MSVLPGNMNPPIAGNDATVDPAIFGQKGDLRLYNPVTLRFDRLPVGTNGQVLTMDSTQPLGIKWA
jgi:hypothetical protein